MSSSQYPSTTLYPDTDLYPISVIGNYSVYIRLRTAQEYNIVLSHYAASDYNVQLLHNKYYKIELSIMGGN